MLNPSVLTIICARSIPGPIHSRILSWRSHVWTTSHRHLWHILSWLFEVLWLSSLPLLLSFLSKWSSGISTEQVTVVITAISLTRIHLRDLARRTSKWHWFRSATAWPYIWYYEFELRICFNRCWNKLAETDKLFNRDHITRINCVMMVIESSVELFFNFLLSAFARFYVGMIACVETS